MNLKTKVTNDQTMDGLKEEDGSGMKEALRSKPVWGGKVARRSFMKNLALGGAALLPAGAAFADGKGDHENHDHENHDHENHGHKNHGHEDRDHKIPKGDADILRFLAAAEILEADLWQQYNEL